MLNLDELYEAVSDMKDGRIVFEDFERWLRRESRNVHAWGDQKLVAAVLAVESVLSEHRFAGMSESDAKKELTRIARPFGPRIVSIDSYSPADPYTSSKPQDLELGLLTRKSVMAQGSRVQDRRIDYLHG
jgi:hypothetical protein